jgi:hypothetical protein
MSCLLVEAFALIFLLVVLLWLTLLPVVAMVEMIQWRWEMDFANSHALVVVSVYQEDHSRAMKWVQVGEANWEAVRVVLNRRPWEIDLLYWCWC